MKNRINQRKTLATIKNYYFCRKNRKTMKFKLYALLLTLSLTLQSLTAQLYKVPFEQKMTQSTHIVEGKILSSRAFWSANKRDIYTAHTVEIYNVFKGELVGSQVEIITWGGQLDGVTQTWTHLLTLHKGQEGIFCLEPAGKYHDYSHAKQKFEMYEVFSSSQGFFAYHVEKQRLTASEPFGKYDVENELKPQIRNFTGQNEKWVFTNKGIQYSFRNPSLDTTGGKNVLAFDVYANGTQNGTKYDSAVVVLKYDTTTFGSSVCGSGGLVVTKGLIVTNSAYQLNCNDKSSNEIQFSIGVRGANPSHLYSLKTIAEQLIHVQITIQNCNPTHLLIDSASLTSYYLDGNNLKSYNPIQVLNSLSNQNVCVPPHDPAITSIFPLSRRAGVGDIITVNGSGFGTYANGFSRVQFTKVSGTDPIFTPMIVISKDIISWTDTLIQVRVPSTNDSNEVAGSGFIAIVDSLSGNPTESTDSITIRFGNINFYQQYLNLSSLPDSNNFPQYLGDIDGLGGYTFKYIDIAGQPSFRGDYAARACFEKAIAMWRCATGVRIRIDTTNTDTSIFANFVTYDLLPTGIAMATTNYHNLCLDGSGQPVFFQVTKQARVIVNSDTAYYNHLYKDANSTTGLNNTLYDLVTAFLHELGHFHCLTHTNNPNDLMYPFISKGQAKRAIAGNDFEGGNYVMGQSTTITTGNCDSVMTPIICPLCDSVFSRLACTSIDKNTNNRVSLNVYPNPFSDAINIDFYLLENQGFSYEILDVLGRSVLKNNKTKVNIGENHIELKTNELSNGIYFAKINIGSQLFTFKLVLQR